MCGRSWIIRVSWTIGLALLFGLAWYLLWYNRFSPDVWSAFAPLGSVLVAAYGLFVLSSSEQSRRKSTELLIVIIAANCLLLTEAIRFVMHGVPVPPRKHITISHVWSVSTGEIFPKGTLSSVKQHRSYMNNAQRIVGAYLKSKDQSGGHGSEEELLGRLRGVTAGYDLTELLILERLREVFEHSWEARIRDVRTLVGRSQEIEEYLQGRPGRVVERSEVLDLLKHNRMAQYLSDDFRVTLPPDVHLRVTKQGLHGHTVYSAIFLDGEYCDATIGIGGGNSSPYFGFDKNLWVTEVRLELEAECSRWSRGHPEMNSRLDWVERVMNAIEMEFSNEGLGAE